MTLPFSQRILGAIVAGVVVVALLFFLLGRATPPRTVVIAPPTATAIQPTPTPHLTIQAPHVLAVYLPAQQIPCGVCSQVPFTSTGPFVVLASCNPYGIFADSEPSYSLQLFDGNGHLIDTVAHTCGDPNGDPRHVATSVTPEALPAGAYQLTVGGNGLITVTILSAV